MSFPGTYDFPNPSGPIWIDPRYQPTHNGPLCPTCRKPYIQSSISWTTTATYQPRHRKPGPAQ